VGVRPVMTAPSGVSARIGVNEDKHCRPLVGLRGQEMSDFKPGDVVQLKSGGPVMTIKFIDEDGDVFCEWFDKKDELKAGRFTVHQLTTASY
jgi:uncharacterized protein YodC (DUF2158 family)